MKKSWKRIGIVVVLALAIVFSVGQEAYETGEIPKVNSVEKQRPPLGEGVHIIVYQQGKKTELDSPSDDLRKLQSICERMVSSAHLAPTPVSPSLEQIVENLRKNSEVIEINYVESKTFNISDYKIETTELVIPLHTFISDDLSSSLSISSGVREGAEFFILDTETLDYVVARLSGNKAEKYLSRIKGLLLKFNIFIL